MMKSLMSMNISFTLPMDEVGGLQETYEEELDRDVPLDEVKEHAKEDARSMLFEKASEGENQ